MDGPVIRRVLKVQPVCRGQRQSSDVVAGGQVTDAAVLRYRYDALVQSHVVIWAKAKNIAGLIGAIVRPPYRSQVRSLGVWSSRGFDHLVADLASKVVQPLNPLRDRGIPNETLDGRVLALSVAVRCRSWLWVGNWIYRRRAD